MYESHFGLQLKPFDVSPDPRFFYVNAAYREAFSTLVYAVRERRGFALLVGEVGTGKSTVIRRAIAELEPRARCVLFQNTMLDFDALVGEIGEALHLMPAPSLASRLAALQKAMLTELEADRTVALFVDEAQQLSDDALEKIRLLSNLETATTKLIQIVLVGQPELTARLAQPQLRQLRQRITVRAGLGPLAGAAEVGGYIDYRLGVAGLHGRSLFTRDAVAAIAELSKGVPRVVNVICDNALLVAFAAGGRAVSAALVHDVARELEVSSGTPPVVAPAPAAPVPAPATPSTVMERPRRRSVARWGWGAAGLALGAGIVGAPTVLTSERVAPLPSAQVLLPTPQRVTPAIDVASAAQPAGEVQAESSAAPSAETPSDAASSAPPSETAAAAAVAAAPEPPPPDADRTLIVPRGATLAELVHTYYDDDRYLAMDVVQDANRFISDVDYIHAGATVRLPALTAETLSRQQSDGRQRVLIASLPDGRAARAMAAALRSEGWKTRLTPRALSPRLRLTRVEIVNLPDRAAARRAANDGRRLRLAYAALQERTE